MESLIWDPSTTLADVEDGSADGTGAAYAAMLEQSPVARYDDGDGGFIWGIFSHDEIAKAAVDYKTFSNVTVPKDGPRIMPLMADPPEHTPYRRLVNQFFAKEPIARVEAEVRPIAAEMIDAMVAAGGGEFGRGYAYAYSTRVLCRFLRVKEDWQVYDEWTSEMERLTGSGVAPRASAGLPIEHLMKVTPYLLELISERRASPGDDIVSGIATGKLGDEPMDDQAVLMMIMTLIMAGRSTSASGIGNLVLRLARDPELQQFLRENPDRIPDAVEESLRIDTPQQQMPRLCVQDIEIDGQTIKAGDTVFVNYGSANVDPAHWERPGEFDIDRPVKRHMAFGRGVHLCFGAPLGRMQMRVSVEELLARTSSFELAGEIERRTWPRLSVEKMPLRMVAAEAS
ncbi:MAG TPA: cytochrome P450 [Solirubrobacteraceae bacterium]|nr:cytochrome P450 [Solirubrobacteraceae bacterium]